MFYSNRLYFDSDSPSLLLVNNPNHPDLIDRDLIDSSYPIDLDGHRCDCLHTLINDISGSMDIRNMPSLSNLSPSSSSIPESLVEDVLDSSNPLSPNRRCDTLVERQTRFEMLHDYSEFNKQPFNLDDNETNSKKLLDEGPSSCLQPDNSVSSDPSNS